MASEEWCRGGARGISCSVPACVRLRGMIVVARRVLRLTVVASATRGLRARPASNLVLGRESSAPHGQEYPRHFLRHRARRASRSSRTASSPSSTSSAAARAARRHGRRHLPRQGHPRPARAAGRVHRHRARARRVPPRRGSHPPDDFEAYLAGGRKHALGTGDERARAGDAQRGRGRRRRRPRRRVVEAAGRRGGRRSDVPERRTRRGRRTTRTSRRRRRPRRRTRSTRAADEADGEADEARPPTAPTARPPTTTTRGRRAPSTPRASRAIDAAAARPTPTRRRRRASPTSSTTVARLDDPRQRRRPPAAAAPREPSTTCSTIRTCRASPSAIRARRCRARPRRALDERRDGGGGDAVGAAGAVAAASAGGGGGRGGGGGGGGGRERGGGGGGGGERGGTAIAAALTAASPGRLSKSTPIREVVKEGQEIIVQVSKEPIGTKGARCTSHVSLPGRYVVYLPTVEHVGISKRIGSRQGARAPARGHREHEAADRRPHRAHGRRGPHEEAAQAGRRLPRAPLGRDREEARGREARRRCSRASSISCSRRRAISSPTTSTRSSSTTSEQYERLVRFVEMFMPERVKDIELYQATTSRSSTRTASRTRSAARSSRKVPLPSGGYLIIDQAEALTAIDVNTGRFVGKGTKDMEETILKTNLEAVNEIAYQLRFRNIGGLIILDLIDMEKRVEPREGAAHARGAPPEGQGEDDAQPHLGARPHRDDAQAHAREPRPPAARAVLLLRRHRPASVEGDDRATRSSARSAASARTCRATRSSSTRTPPSPTCSTGSEKDARRRTPRARYMRKIMRDAAQGVPPRAVRPSGEVRTRR